MGDSILGRLLGWVGGGVCAYPRWFVYPQIALAMGCLVYAAYKLKLDTNRDHLVGSHIRAQQIFLGFEKEFPGEGNDLVVVVESDHLERNRQFIERLAAKVSPETNLFTDLFYRADLTTLGPKALFLASTNDLEQMRRSLRDYRPLLAQFSQATNLDSLFSLVNQQFRYAGSAPSGQAESLTQAIPFLQSIVSQALQDCLRSGPPPPPGIESLLFGGHAAEQQIYVTRENGRLFLLTVRPRNEALTGEAIERLRDVVRATQVEVPGVAVGVTGGPVLDYDEMRQAEHDTTRASILAFVLCGVLFIMAYRQLGRPLKAAVCLLIGLGYTLGFTTLVIGHLNILTITFAPMLIGLAIDFGVHFISRFEEEMRNRNAPPAAVDHTLRFTGQGIVTGALTTAAAFLAMALTHFKGIAEMGIISGCGLVLCLVPMLTSLPALLLRGRQNLRDRDIGPAGQTRLHIEFLWLRHPLVVLAVTFLSCIAASLTFHKLRFDYDLLHMQSQSLPSVVYERRLIRSAGASSLYGAVIADSRAQARQFEDRLQHLPAVAEVRSAADFLTPDQEQKRELIGSIKQDLAGIRFAPLDRRPIQAEPLSATLWYLTGYLGLGAKAADQADPQIARELRALAATVRHFRVVLLEPRPRVREQLTRFQQGLLASFHHEIQAIQHQDTSGPLRIADLPAVLRDRFIGATGKYLVQVYPRADLWQHANQSEFIEQLRSVVPWARVTGVPFELYQYTTLLKNSYEQAAGYAVVAIVLMVLLHFRSPGAVLLALLPVAVGSIWLLGLMCLAEIPFNPANIMTLPLVLGIGVTNGVQILNRYAEEQQPSILAKSTGKAVLVSGLTAVVGFGSLMIAQHQGIRSLGIVMSAGIAACMMAALAVLPALLRVLKHSERSNAQPESSTHPALSPKGARS